MSHTFWSSWRGHAAVLGMFAFMAVTVACRSTNRLSTAQSNNLGNTAWVDQPSTAKVIIYDDQIKILAMPNLDLMTAAHDRFMQFINAVEQDQATPVATLVDQFQPFDQIATMDQFLLPTIDLSRSNSNFWTSAQRVQAQQYFASATQQLKDFAQNPTSGPPPVTISALRAAFQNYVQLCFGGEPMPGSPVRYNFWGEGFMRSLFSRFTDVTARTQRPYTDDYMLNAAEADLIAEGVQLINAAKVDADAGARSPSSWIEAVENEFRIKQALLRLARENDPTEVNNLRQTILKRGKDFNSLYGSHVKELTPRLNLKVIAVDPAAGKQLHYEDYTIFLGTGKKRAWYMPSADDQIRFAQGNMPPSMVDQLPEHNFALTLDIPDNGSVPAGTLWDLPLSVVPENTPKTPDAILTNLLANVVEFDAGSGTYASFISYLKLTKEYIAAMPTPIQIKKVEVPKPGLQDTRANSAAGYAGGNDSGDSPDSSDQKTGAESSDSGSSDQSKTDATRGGR